MAEDKTEDKVEDRKDADPNEMLSKIADAIGGLTKRMDAMERDDAARRDSGRKDGEDEEKKEEGVPKEVAADKGRKDGEDEKSEDEKKADAARKDAEEKAEEERKADAARRDAAVADSIKSVTERIADVEKALPRQRSDIDRLALVDAQAAADRVFHAYGDSAPRALDGEDLGGYRRRMVGLLKDRTTKWRGVNPGLLVDPAAFDAIEAEVYADAMAAASSAAGIPAFTMRESVRREGGHEFREFHGDPRAWMNPIAGPRQAVISGLEPGATRH